jgi:hypothetical protein
MVTRGNYSFSYFKKASDLCERDNPYWGKAGQCGLIFIKVKKR